jgi:DNA polymerase-3 subunit delta
MAAAAQHSGQPDPVVYVEGDDATLVANAVSSLVDDLLGTDDRSLAMEEFGGEEVDLSAVADACATPPLLSARRIVVVRDVGRFSTDEVRPLLSYVETPLDTSILVLAAGEGTIPAKLLAAVKAAGTVVSTKVSGRDAPGWVRSQLRDAGLRVDAEAEALIVSHLGEDLGRLPAVVEVLLAAYGGGGDGGGGGGQAMGPDQVLPYLGEAGSVAPWDFTDAIDAGQTEQALLLLHRLLNAGARHPLVVLATLHRHLQGLMRVDSPSVRTEAQAAQAMGIAAGRSTYPAKKALTAAGRWGSTGIGDGIGLLADAELALKGASSLPAEAVLEVLVARLCRLARAGAGGADRRRAPSRA